MARRAGTDGAGDGGAQLGFGCGAEDGDLGFVFGGEGGGGFGEALGEPALGGA